MSIYPGVDGKVRPVRNKNSLSQKALLLAFGLPVLLIVLLPIGALLGSASPSTILQYLGDDLTRKALKLSMVSSLIATGLILLFGTPLAFFIARGQQSRSARLLAGFLDLTVIIPPAVAGLGLLLVFGQHGFLGELANGSCFGLVAVVLAQFFVACPYYIKSAAASLSAVPSVLKDAAFLEGASKLQIFIHITWPLAWRGFVAGAALSWARGLGEFGATLIFAGNIPGRTQTMPLAIFSYFSGAEPRALVVAVVLLVLSFGFVAVTQGLSRGRCPA